ncbi:MAG: ABC transporter substrate-binding protein [Geminicoccaceae bacterium]
MFRESLKNHMQGLALAIGAASLALGAMTPAHAEGVLDGETIRILGIGDPVFQVMQRIHGDLEEMAGGTIQLDVRPFDVLHQQVLLNAQNDVSSYDLIAVDLPQFGEYMHFLTSLNPLIEEHNFDGSDFHDVAWTGAQFGGQQLGIPLQPHPEIFAYRTDIFEKYGLDAPKTHADVLAAGKTVQENEEGMAGVCWNAARGTPIGQAFIMTQGDFGAAPIDMVKVGDDFDMGNIKPENMHPTIDTPAGKATMDYFLSLLDMSPPGILNMAWDERVRVFAQGGCAMTYIWSGRSAIYELDEEAPARGNVGYVPHPSGPDSPNRSTLGGWYLSIPTNIGPDRIQLAWKVIDWLTSPEMIAEYTKHGNCVAPRKSVSADADVIARCPVIPHVSQMAEDGFMHGWQRPPVPEIQKIVDVMGAETHSVLTGDVTPEEALANAQRLLDREMRKAGYY